LIEGATENTAVVQALIDNLIERGLDPKVCRLFIIDGAKALSKVIRSTFGRHTPIQRRQVHKSHNVIERLPKPPGHGHVGVHREWELSASAVRASILRKPAVGIGASRYVRNPCRASGGAPRGSPYDALAPASSARAA
jgi:hypothetical protein